MTSAVEAVPRCFLALHGAWAVVVAETFGLAPTKSLVALPLSLGCSSTILFHTSGTCHHPTPGSAKELSDRKLPVTDLL